MKQLCRSLRELEAAAGRRRGPLSDHFQANLVVHCQRKVAKLTAKFNKLSAKFSEKAELLRQEREGGQSFLSTDQTVQEESMRTQTSEKSMDSNGMDFERLELERLSRSIDEVSQLFQTVRERLRERGWLNRRHGGQTRYQSILLSGRSSCRAGGEGAPGSGAGTWLLRPLHPHNGVTDHLPNVFFAVEDILINRFLALMFKQN